MEKLVIIDGNSLVNRAFYALPPLATSKGKVYNAVFGFVNTLLKLITENKPSHLMVAFDAGRKTFRNDIYKDYKAQRKPMPNELAEQLAPLKTLLQEMGIKILEKVGIEADDIIGTLSKRLDYPCVIVTGDRDCLQLIDDKTEVWLTKHGISSIVSMNERQLKEDTGLTPSQIIDLKALMGDSSDNIPGIAGIGPKTATDLLLKYGTLDGVYQNLVKISGKVYDKLVQGEESARMSYKLATIDVQSDVDCSLQDCEVNMPFSKEVYNLFAEYEFNSLLKRTELFEEVAQESVKKEEIKVVPLNSVDELSGKIGNKVAILEKEGKIEVAVDERTVYSVEGDNALLSHIFANENIQKVIHKIKPLMHSLNGEVKNCLDISLAVYLINSGIKNEDFSRVLGFFNIEGDSASALWKVWDKIEQQLQQLELDKLYFELELPLTYILYEMEKQGICVDEQILDQLSQKFGKEIEDIRKEILVLAGVEFNVNSPKQLADILFNHLGLNMKGNKKQSTAVDKLEALRGAHPIIDLILRYRTVSKMLSTYIDGLKPYVRAGKIHTTFNQTQTVTGRLSSNEPNLQNIPVRTQEGRVLRKIFVASADSILLDADYSQIELRLLAHYSGDQHLISAYHNNKDIHTTTASQIFNTPFNEVSAEQRRMAKAVNFGIIYGISPYGLSVGAGISIGEARIYIDKYFDMYPTIKGFLENSVENAKNQGFVSTLLGRRRNISEIYSTNHNVSMFGERAAMNMPLQGSASDIIKLAMLKISEQIKEKQLKSKLILQIHDELIFDVPLNEKEQMTALVKNCMENVISLKVPLIVDITTGKNWFEC